MGVENRWIGRLLEDSGSGAQWHIDLWLKAQGKVEHSLLSFAAMADRAVLAKPDRPTGGCDFDVVVTAALVRGVMDTPPHRNPPRREVGACGDGHVA